MGSYILHPRVEPELWEIWQYIAWDNPEAATRVVAAAEQTFQLLAEQPGLGRIYRSGRLRRQTMRFRTILGFRNYLVIYREITGGIEVLYVCHAARNLDALLRQDD